jgi:hypothetical protein
MDAGRSIAATDGISEEFNVVVSVSVSSKPLTLIIGRQVEGWYEMNLRNKLNLAMGILLLISLVSCSTPPLESLTLEVDQNWVIVTREQAEGMGVASWLVGSGNFWTPSADDIFKLEEGLAEYLSQNSSYFYRQPPVWQRLDEYQRQFIGLERGGRQIIYGNFFCNNIGMDWRKILVIVDDGGDCYFQVEYDVESGLFIKLMVNGEA